jgi:hypothetical protein
MQWVSVKSSAISRVAYENGEIYLDWKEPGNFDIYAYRAPEHIYSGIFTTNSIGNYANKVIKKYISRKIN